MAEPQTRLTSRRITRRSTLLVIAGGAAGLLVACAQAPSAVLSSASASPAGAKPRWGMTAAQDAAWTQIEAAAKKEGKVTYYTLGSVPANQVDKLKSLWKSDYPDIEIEYLNVGNNAQLNARLVTEQESKTVVGDVADLGITRVLQLDPAFLEAFIPPASQDPTVKWIYNPVADPGRKGLVTADFAQFFSIWTNSNLVKAADAPKTLMDVATNPKWKGQIIWRSPWTVGGGNHTYIFAKQVYGMDWVTKMQAQNPTFADDQDAALLQVARGEFAIGIGLTGRTAGQLIKDRQPIAAVWPEDFVVTVTNGSPIMRGAPHPNAAKVFANWMLTERGQTMWRDLGQFPLRTDILPTEPWMQGVSKAKQVYENLLAPAPQQAALDEATRSFKK
jgi:iron(III) transport system substrate-binding protein